MTIDIWRQLIEPHLPPELDDRTVRASLSEQSWMLVEGDYLASYRASLGRADPGMNYVPFLKDLASDDVLCLQPQVGQEGKFTCALVHDGAEAGSECVDSWVSIPAMVTDFLYPLIGGE